MKHNIFNSLILSGLILVGASTIVMAQGAPGSRSVDSTRASKPSDGRGPRAKVNENPCPEPKRALASTPDDMAKIQEDITRFTLCVQRAQLLERLNELAESNINTIDTALNLAAPVPNVDGNAEPGIMPSVPMPQLSESMSQMLNENGNATTSSQSSVVGSNAPQQPPKRNEPSPWRVRDIQGTGGSISARLVNNEGIMFKVKQGQSLPNDGGKVQSLSNTLVVIERDGDTEILKWVE